MKYYYIITITMIITIMIVKIDIVVTKFFLHNRQEFRINTNKKKNTTGDESCERGKGKTSRKQNLGQEGNRRIRSANRRACANGSLKRADQCSWPAEPDSEVRRPGCQPPWARQRGPANSPAYVFQEPLSEK